jgi:C-terminal processing protease CtpA/Prc
MKQSQKWLRGAAGAAFALTTMGAASIAFAQDATPVPETEAAQTQSQERPFLGIQLQRSEVGVVVEGVLAESPAETAGLQSGDVITAVNGEALENPRDLVQVIAGLSVGDTVSLTFTRDGEEQTADVTLAAFPAEFEESVQGFGGRPFGGEHFGGGRRDFAMPFGGAMIQMFGGNGWLGLSFQPIDAQVAEENSLTVTEGALVIEIVEGSPAATVDLQAGDVITAVNGEAVDEERTLRDRLIAYEPDDTVTLTVLRDGETLDVDVTLAQPEFSADMIMPFMGGMPGMEGGFFQMPVDPNMPGIPNIQELPPVEVPQGTFGI